MKKQPIPVTILTGFLGAGKTTLLNHIIQQNPDSKFAIIENEFGDIGIDNELVIGADDGIFEMSNGCICCALNDELIETLAKLLNSEHHFDQLIIETTGIAEPDGVAAAFVSDPNIQEYFRLDATICLADANNIEDMLEEREEAKRQVTFADFIILNKKSDVSSEYLEKLTDILHKANPMATIERADYGKVNTNILSIKAYEEKTVSEKINAVHQHSHDNHHHHHKHDHNHDHDHTHKDHTHDHDHKHHHNHHSDIVTHSFVFDQAFDVLKFRHWLNVLLMIQGKSLYRVKGIMDFQFQDQKTIVQSVRQMHVFQAGPTWEEGEKRVSKIVFIGKQLRKDILEKNLKHCLYKNPMQ
ncbi:MAG: GTP-binding protein [Aureispira sp.]|nr:GTP-binding protein [Aureispira sp.]